MALFSFVVNNTVASTRRINTTNSPLQFLSVVYQSITHSFKPAVSTTYLPRSYSIKMRELPPQCTHLDQHHNLSGNSETPHTRSGPTTRHLFRNILNELTGTSSEHTRAKPSSDHHRRNHELPISSPPSSAISPTNPTTYLCTFCWRPHHPAVTPSRVVGRRARLACQPCYGALLNLAVCWVCGEVVFRGDECVSLGWCFWHRACYGCLMCGDRRLVEGIMLEQIFDEQDAPGTGGKEVEEVPLCANCVEEVGWNRYVDEEHLIPMALERVERFDGGLSRRRWEARQQREPPLASGSSRPPQQEFEDPRRTPSPIYVSARDPLGEPSFRRSSTKPIPKWMRYLPSQMQATRDSLEPRPASVLDSYFTAADSENEPGESSPPPPVSSHTVPVRQTQQTYAPVQMSRPFTFITEEPVQRPSSTTVANKHVRFTPSTLSPQQTTCNDRDEIPSESSEFLDRYHVRTAAAGRGTTSSTRIVPSYYDDHHARAVSPFLKRFETDMALSRAEGVLHGLDVKDEDGSCPRAEQRHPRQARSALELASRYGVAQCRKDGEKGHSIHHEYSHSPVSHLHGDVDGVLDSALAKRRPLTFQDQLKRVFGFA